MTIVASLGLVLLLMSEARRPDRCRWLCAQQPGGVDSAAPESRPNPPGDYFPGVDASLLAAVLDDTPSRFDERPAWLNLLGVLARTDETVLEKASLGPTTFRQLHQQSGEYRGKLVTIRGAVKRVEPVPPPANGVGITRCFKLVFQPQDEIDYPIIVYCLELPDGFPMGETIEEKAEITGFHFKRVAYKGTGKKRGPLWTAPEIAAKTLRWIETPPPAPDRMPGPGTSIALLALVLAGGVMTAIFAYYRTRRKPAGQPEAIAALDRLAEAVESPEAGPAAGESADDARDRERGDGY
jgi:hypothetical protein